MVAARAAYNVPETGQRLKPGQKPGDRYVEANMRVVRERLFGASVRLATVLHECFLLRQVCPGRQRSESTRRRTSVLVIRSLVRLGSLGGCLPPLLAAVAGPAVGEEGDGTERRDDGG